MFDTLPIELKIYIFKNYFNLKDLMIMRCVSKQWKELSEDKSVKITELVIAESVEYVMGSWFYDDKVINFKDAIKYSLFRSMNSTFNFEQNLRRLNICFGAESNLNLFLINKMISLEQLDLNIQCKLNAFHELRLDNLKILYLKYSATKADIDGEPIVYKISLYTPHLIVLKAIELSSIKLCHLSALRHLEIEYYHYDLDVDLKCDNLEIFHLLIDKSSLGNLLTRFPNLKKLVCNLDSLDRFDEMDEFVIVEDLKDVLKEKARLNKNDLKIYFEGVEIENESKISEYFNCNHDHFSFVIKYYDKSDDKIPFIYSVMYERLMTLVDNRLPKNFFNKFLKIEHVHLSGKLEDSDHFIFFLSNLSLLRILGFYNTSLDQDLFDKVANTCKSIGNLMIMGNSIPLNFDFILKFKNLRYLDTDQNFLHSSGDLAIDSFENLRYLACIRFACNEGFVGIKKNSQTEFSFSINTQTSIRKEVDFKGLKKELTKLFYFVV